MGSRIDLINDMNLPSGDALDALFSSQEERDDERLERVTPIGLDMLHDFKNHPFQVRDDEEMARLIESVKQNGVLMPVLVRPAREGGYEIVSGHRRKRAADLAEQETIPCIVRNLTDDEATILMVDSNLQREEILPSEKAFAYKMKLDAMKRQGKRTDLTSAPVEPKLKGTRSNEQLAANSPDSRPQIQRYIRLTELIPGILQMVDDGKIKLRPAVELSYLKPQEQEELLSSIGSQDCTPSHAQAIRMRKFSQEGTLSKSVIDAIMSEEKPNQKDQFHIGYDKLKRYFPDGASEKEITRTIIKALELYRHQDKDYDDVSLEAKRLKHSKLSTIPKRAHKIKPP